LESVEILRGPQGLLFGRNVTGGAVLVRTKRPSEELSIEARAAVSSGPEKLVSASVSGPILEDRLGLKFAVYGSDDDGYFTNLFDGSAFGEDRTRLFRAAADWRGSETFDLIARVESGRSEGDGPAAQSRGLFDRNSFDFSIDERGLHDNEWESASLEANWRVGFGDGTITNVLGWRRYDQTTLADIDSSPDLIFVSATFLEQEQYSNELRYAGRFADRADLTAGLYYFTQDIAYQETRLIPILAAESNSQYGGGLQDQNTFGAFAQSDIDLTSDVNLTLGLRYTYEEKSAVIGTVRALGVAVEDPLLVPAGACNALIGECVDPVTGADLFVRDSESWSNLTPKIGGQWRISDDLQIYGFWTRGFRSGGYNVRNTNAATAAVPFDEERQDSFELGAKGVFWDGRARLSGAAFYNDVSDLQREVNLADPEFGVVQIITNAGDATIAGFELEGVAQLTEALGLRAAVGYVDGSYDTVRFDISGDGVVDAADRALRLPRLAPWTYSAGFTFDTPLSELNSFQLRADFSHRDSAAYTDNNLGTLNAADMLQAAATLFMQNGRLAFSVFGQNLLDEVTEGNDTQLPFFEGATFSPLNKGRVIGGEIRFRY
ncbi:MAG: TonB-dependent receptor, partial [Pseudomonadota bacterium]